ncbi:MAG: hypothetical protein OXI64_12530 [Defluviicoccus sp.]|nr:hypothetical protein [Defluviicoccus sp.]
MNAHTEIASSLGDWLYWYGPSMETLNQFMVSVLAAMLAVILVIWIRPDTKIWTEEKIKFLKDRTRKRKDIIKKLQEIGLKPKNEEELKKQRKLLITLVRSFVWPIVLIPTFILSGFVLVDYLEEQDREITRNTKLTTKKYIELIDKKSTDLSQETIARKTTTASEDHERLFSILACHRAAWLYGIEKWYSGYSEIDRLRGTIQTYEMCMFKNGWDTKPCKADDKKDTKCYDIPFEESYCLREARAWLDGRRSRQPCQEVRSWMFQHRQEPTNRQW